MKFWKLWHNRDFVLVFSIGIVNELAYIILQHLTEQFRRCKYWLSLCNLEVRSMQTQSSVQRALGSYIVISPQALIRLYHNYLVDLCNSINSISGELDSQLCTVETIKVITVSVILIQCYIAHTTLVLIKNPLHNP